METFIKELKRSCENILKTIKDAIFVKGII